MNLNIFSTQKIKHTPHIVCADYLGSLLDPEHLARMAKVARENLSSYDFDTIAFRGMSGALSAPVVATALGKSLVLVRKPGDSRHSCFNVEGDTAAKRYIVIDDSVSSGTTLATIIRAMREFAPNAVYVGFWSATRLAKELDYVDYDKQVKDEPPAPKEATNELVY